MGFDELAPNTKVGGQYASLGMSVSLIGSDNPTVFPAIDSDGVYTAVHGTLGNFLLPEVVDGDAFDIRFTFSSPIDYFSILVLDAEEVFDLRTSLG